MKKNSLNKITAFLLVCVLIFSFTACSQDNDSDSYDNLDINSLNLPDDVEKFAEYLMNGNTEKAIDYYNNKIEGNLSAMYEANNVFSQLYLSVANNLLNGKTDELTAETEIKKLCAVADVTSASIGNDFIERYNAVVESKKCFKQGQTAMSSDNYEQAIEYFENIMADDVNYDSGLALIEEAKGKIKENALSQAKTFADGNKYPDAIKVLNNALDTLENDAELSDKLQEYSDLFAEKSINEAENAFVNAESDWSKALNIIKSAQQIIPNNDALKQKEEYYLLFQPVDLLSTTPFDHDFYYKLSSSAKDNMGNTYSNVLSSNGIASYAVFDIGKKYNKLSFRCAMKEGTNYSDSNTYVRVYGDNRLLYEKENFGPSVKPFDVELDVTGVTDLKIEYKGNWYATDRVCIILSDFKLVRTVK